jgi:ankyrin repeat protein
LEQNTIDIACQDQYGFSPLKHAASQNNPFAVTILLKKGANMITANRRRVTLLNWAVNYGSTAMVDVLLNSLSSTPLLPLSEPNEIDQINSWSLHIAADGGKFDIIQRLLDHGYDVNTKDSEHQTPLCLAARRGYLRVVNLILRQRDIDLNGADIRGMTPIWLASRYRRDKVARRLLAIPHLDVNAAVTEITVSPESSTSLHHVVFFFFLGIASLLLANNRLNSDVTDHLSRTPLHWA